MLTNEIWFFFFSILHFYSRERPLIFKQSTQCYMLSFQGSNWILTLPDVKNSWSGVDWCIPSSIRLHCPLGQISNIIDYLLEDRISKEVGGIMNRTFWKFYGKISKTQGALMLLVIAYIGNLDLIPPGSIIWTGSGIDPSIHPSPLYAASRL